VFFVLFNYAFKQIVFYFVIGYEVDSAMCCSMK